MGLSTKFGEAMGSDSLDEEGLRDRAAGRGGLDVKYVENKVGGSREKRDRVEKGNVRMGTGCIRSCSQYWKVKLTHGAAGEGSNVLQGSGLGSGGGNDDGVLHGVVLLKGLDELSDGGALLADGDVDAVELLGLVVAGVPALLVQDGVESDGGLAGLTIADNQLTLATADGHHGVDGLETGLDGLADGLAGQDTGGLELGTALLGGLDGTLAVNGVAESVDNAAEQSLTDGDVDLFTRVRTAFPAIWG